MMNNRPMGLPTPRTDMLYAIIATDIANSLDQRLAARPAHLDRKSTRLNSSHSQISNAVFCLKKYSTAPDRITEGRLDDRVRPDWDSLLCCINDNSQVACSNFF